MSQLHLATKKKAVKKYAALLEDGHTRAEIENLLIEEEYTSEERMEIFEGIDDHLEKITNGKIEPGGYDPANPNSIIENDFNYNNLTGEEFKRYETILEKLCPVQGIEEHTFKLFDFELYHAKPLFKQRFEGMDGSPVDFIGIKLKTVGINFEPPISPTRISIHSVRTLNEQIKNTHSRAGYGKYYLLKK
jgi:hypothetical protein